MGKSGIISSYNLQRQDSCETAVGVEANLNRKRTEKTNEGETE